jgi:hypothetical protein
MSVQVKTHFTADCAATRGCWSSGFSLRSCRVKNPVAPIAIFNCFKLHEPLGQKHLSHRWTQIHTDEIKIVVVSVFIRVDRWLFFFIQFWFRPQAGLIHPRFSSYMISRRVRVFPAFLPS